MLRAIRFGTIFFSTTNHESVAVIGLGLPCIIVMHRVIVGQGQTHFEEERKRGYV